MNKVINAIGKWLAYMVLTFIFIMELTSMGLNERDFIYWLIAVPGFWGLSWIVEKLDNEHSKEEEK